MSVDLEDCNNYFHTCVGNMYVDDLDVNSFLNPPFKKSHPYSYASSSDSLYELPSDVLDIRSDIPEFMERTTGEYFDPLPDYLDFKRTFDDSDLPTFGNSSLSDIEPDLLLVSPDSILPNPLQRDEIESLESIWPGFDLCDPRLIKLENDCLDDYVSLDDIFVKNRPKKFTHLDTDHCYSQRPPVQYDDYFNSSPCSPESSSCSDNPDESRGVKRKSPKKKAVRRKKIKREVTSSSDDEVDVETPCTIPLVPKITIAISPSTTPLKRGRKPKDKSKGQIVEKSSNKNCPVSPKVLQAAIKQQKKKSYVTKSGRVTKISNSVETTPSTSTPSSVNNSRCNSDNEDTVDKRASHNMAERNRRQELTNLFQQLRQKVPETKKNSKASKVSILQSSTSHIGELEEMEKQKKRLKEQMKAELENKLAILESLKNSRGCSS